MCKVENVLVGNHSGTTMDGTFSSLKFSNTYSPYWKLYFKGNQLIKKVLVFDVDKYVKYNKNDDTINLQSLTATNSFLTLQ